INHVELRRRSRERDRRCGADGRGPVRRPARWIPHYGRRVRNHRAPPNLTRRGIPPRQAVPVTKRWVIAGIAVIVLVAGGAVVVAVNRGSSKSYFCEGLGLRGPSASTPEAALDAVLRPRHGTIDEWKRDDQRSVKPPRDGAPYEVVDFVPRDMPVRPPYSRIVVSNLEASWRATGACAAPRTEE